MAEVHDIDPSNGRAVTLAGLIYKYREKEPLTAGEQKNLDDWLNENEANKKLFDELLQRDRLAAELESLKKYNEDNAVFTIFAALGVSPSAVIPLRKHPLRRTLAAASIILILIAGAWFFITRRNQTAEPPPIANAELQRDRAILTLADGRRLPLDSAHAGPMGTQGAASLQLQKDRLIYTTANKTATNPTVYNTITVPRGAQYHVILADSTEVWLNSASSVRYPAAFTATNREVTITGEAWFSVAKDATKPFLVTAGTMKVRVLGTEFNIMAYDDEPAIRTTLINGAVKTTVENKQGRPQQQILQPGEQAALNNSSGLLYLEKPNLDEVTGWHNGEFNCHNTPLPAIMRQVARWYDVTVEYQGSVANINYNGQLSRKHSLEDIMDILSDTRKVHFQRKTPDTIVVMPGPK